MSDMSSDKPEDNSFRSDPTDPDSLDRAVAAAAMELAAEKGWRHVGLLEVAHRAGIPLSRFHHRYRGRAEVLAAVSRVADATVLAGESPIDPTESARDRLFDVMMRRFDALRPFRDGLRAVLRDLPADPATALAFSCAFGRSMAWMLRAAGIDPDRRGGAALVAGLGTVHARVMRVFLTDDSADLSRTMAALDNALRGAERWGATFCRWTRSRGPIGKSSGTESMASGI
ncbi:AcrR family transcriptional regulator [Azospirillum lipoferum]|uniref:TetR family transcriptional regulator n=1 Tax=Azospirillum lipoferum TaxID=193 RepID=A0A5A9GYG6_AZOLI|nr:MULTISPECIES: TetR family transcriptional regulator [Azospirillum]KAA0598604.1 TetR family transcriptional regulator [Azospirillum lipoferum]MCP1609382.1 AcrR family transcriptional regulator [Azospirillum lipoferum]MDW5535309.1 TetR family transcriptional regulator [Azospirillum sp. NL1]